MMKVNLKGLLFLARRHLSILDQIIHELGLSKDEWGYEVNSAQLILDELIEHVSEVQADNSKFKEFAELYCLAKSKTITQPTPIRRTTTPIHDLIIIDLIGTGLSDNDLLMKELNDRKAIGLAEYGTPLQAFNGRDCEKDAVEEMADMICYLKQGILEGKTYLEPIYHRAIALAVDTINLRAIHAESEERKAALATAPYYDVVVEVDGVESSHTVQALSREDAARQVLDSVTLGAEIYPDKVELISYDLA
jgi:hypothetical protein